MISFRSRVMRPPHPASSINSSTRCKKGEACRHLGDLDDCGQVPRLAGPHPTTGRPRAITANVNRLSRVLDPDAARGYTTVEPGSILVITQTLAQCAATTYGGDGAGVMVDRSSGWPQAGPRTKAGRLSVAMSLKGSWFTTRRTRRPAQPMRSTTRCGVLVKHEERV